MSLSPGAWLGSYEVTARIGAGGMGEVYQARDTKLDRDVALKVLPDAFTSDPDRLARFEREAKVLASLNHPNIGHIYGLEEAEGTKALVLELVEGPTLADRIAEGPIPVDEVLPIAKQIAEALEAAHEQGIIHRDLKPANVKVKADGTVKVLDFGLAKAFQPDSGSEPSESPTMTAAATRAGVIMGTAAYMAPEQAKGKAVDKRADIWAFGCLLYELVTGHRAFAGGDVAETLAAVIQSEPDWDALPPKFPPTAGTFLRRCLRKDSKERVRDIGDVRMAMEGGFETTPTAPSDATVAPLLHVWQRPVPLIFASLLVAVVVGSIAWRLKPVSPTPRVELSIYPTPEAPLGQLIDYDGPPIGLVFSPDGRELVYVVDQDGSSHLYRRPLDEAVATPIPGTEGATDPFFSPLTDSGWRIAIATPTCSRRFARLAVWQSSLELWTTGCTE